MHSYELSSPSSILLLLHFPPAFSPPPLIKRDTVGYSEGTVGVQWGYSEGTVGVQWGYNVPQSPLPYLCLHYIISRLSPGLKDFWIQGLHHITRSHPKSTKRCHTWLPWWGCRYHLHVLTI